MAWVVKSRDGSPLIYGGKELAHFLSFRDYDDVVAGIVPMKRDKVIILKATQEDIDFAFSNRPSEEAP